MHYLLTGATGYVGKHILARLLDDGHQVTAIARGRNQSARDRVVAALQAFDKTLTPAWRHRLRVLEGDVSQPLCGLEPSMVGKLCRDGVDGVIHSAGLTRFEEHLKDDLMAHNLGGTREAFALAERIASPRFEHISTAFVAGTSRNAFSAQDLDIGQGFNNPYELSKLRTEQFLHDEAHIPTTIYRPSIVVGGHPLGEGNTVSTVYTFLKAVNFLRECFRRDVARGRNRFAAHGLREDALGFHMPIRVAGNPQTPIYLLAIDTLVDDIVTQLKFAPNGVTTRQLHGLPYTLNDLRDAFCEVMQVTGPQFVALDVFDKTPRNPVEEQFFRLTRTYLPYLLSAPNFTSPVGDNRRIDLRQLARDFLVALRDDAPQEASQNVGEMLVKLKGINRARDYFDGLTEADIGVQFLQRHRFIDAAIRFQVKGAEPFDEVIQFRNGAAQYVTHTSPAACSYELDEPLFLRVISGQTDLRKAFFAGQVGISGNKEIALKFGALLGQYYRDIENNVIQELAV